MLRDLILRRGGAFLTAARTLSRLDLISIGLCCLFIPFHLAKILGGDLLAGWDVAGHYYLSLKQLEYLSEGRFSGYDPNWFAGYPAFDLYPPLGYAILQLPHILSFGLIGTLPSFNLMLFLIPIVILIGLYVSARVVLGARYGAPALLFGLLFFALPASLIPLYVGLYSLYHSGLVISFIGIAELLFFITLLELTRREATPLRMVSSGFLLALIVLTHQVTAIYSVWLLFCFWLFQSGFRFRTFCIIGALGALASAFWWANCFRYLWLSSYNLVGWPSDAPEPLLAFFPKLALPFILLLLQQMQAFLDAPTGSEGVKIYIALRHVVTLFPFDGLLFALCVPAGIALLFKREKPFLPASFLFSILVLPGEVLRQAFGLALRGYRSILPLYMLNLLLASYGWREIEGTLAERQSIGWKLGRRAFVALTVVAIVSACFLRFNLTRPAEDWQNKLTFLKLKDAPYYQDAIALLDDLKSLAPTGRIVAECDSDNGARLGSPHFFSVMLPLRYQLESAHSQLIESSLTSIFINPTLYRDSNHIRWGNRDLELSEPFMKQELDSMMERLTLFNIQYLIVSREAYFNSLMDHARPWIVERASRGPFHLLELPRYRPFLEKTSYHPWLFVDAGGADFIQFSEAWYSYTSLFHAPVIYTTKRYEELSAFEQEQIGGLIVSLPSTTTNTRGQIERWSRYGKPMVLLNAPERSASETDNHVRISEGVIATLQDNPPAETEKVAVLRKEAERIEFEAHGGVMVNYSYAPGWHSGDPSQTVFMATPSLMFVFSQGKTLLRYR